MICVALFMVSTPSSPLPHHLPKKKKKDNNNIYVGAFALIMKIKNELCIIKIMLEVILREKDFALITIWINYRTKYSLIMLLGFFFFSNLFV